MNNKNNTEHTQRSEVASFSEDPTSQKQGSLALSQITKPIKNNTSNTNIGNSNK